MRTSLNINIPEPCHEDWNKMTPQDKGRHCSSCEKTVYDFTSKTDEQIVKTYLDEGKVCGRFKSTQLNRELVLSRKEKNNYLSYVASTLFAFLSIGTQDVEAQGKPRVVNVDSTKQSTVNGKLGTSILNTKPIHGIIFSSDKFTIAGAKITVKGSSISTTSDADGNFTIKGKLENVLVIEAIGYETAEITIRDFGKRQIYLKSSSLNYLKTQTNKKNERLIKGNIISRSDGLPLPGITVINLRSKVKTQSDFDGNFSIHANTKDIIKMSFIGLLNYDLEITKKDWYAVKIDDDPDGCGENLIYAGVPDYSGMKKCIRKRERKEKREKIKNGELERTKVGKALYNITNIFRRKE